MDKAENQIVVYQPDGVMRIEVRFDGETVWLPQPQIAELFSCSLENVRLHLKNIYASGELNKEATSKESLEVRREGNRNVTRKFLYYNLDAIISIGYRVNSIVGVRFRQWATQIIKKHVPHRKISDGDVKTFNAQYPKLAVRYNETFHDRFLIIDDKELYLIGASLKDLGRKCFAFTKLDAGEICRIKDAAFSSSVP